MSTHKDASRYAKQEAFCKSLPGDRYKVADKHKYSRNVNVYEYKSKMQCLYTDIHKNVAAVFYAIYVDGRLK